MSIYILFGVALSVLAFALLSKRLQTTVLTLPLIFTALGMLISPLEFGTEAAEGERSAIHLLAEITLTLVLFADAARIRLGNLRRDHDIPLRMLSIGMPLTIIGGGAAAYFLFPEATLPVALLTAAILAPTDAALGQAVVSDEHVPVRIRQALNVESGLNDGIAVPLVIIFATWAAMDSIAGEAGSLALFAAQQLVLGPLSGLAVGYAGARLFDGAAARGWVAGPAEGAGVLALTAACYLTAEILGGSGFIAAFVGGLAFGNAVKSECGAMLEFMEGEGRLLIIATFLLFGAILLPAGIEHITAGTLVLALAVLTVARMIPVALSLIGLGLRARTVLFLGWFGPRGLASIIFVLLVLAEHDIPWPEELLACVVLTVALSVLLHGMTAAPFARRYGKACRDDSAAMKPVSEMALRR